MSPKPNRAYPEIDVGIPLSYVVSQVIASYCCYTPFWQPPRGPILEGREPPLTFRQEKQYLYLGQLFPCTPGPFFAVVRHFFQKNSHRAGPELQEFQFWVCTTGWRLALYLFSLPKGPFRTVFSTGSDSVVFYYSVVNLLRIVIHY